VGRVNRVVVTTPEGISFTLVPAGPIARFVAWVIDLACVSAILIPLSMGLRLVALLSPDGAQAVGIVSYFLVSTGYAIVAEWRFKGRTVGKGLLSMRVVDEEGMSLQPGQIIVRNLLRVVDCLPLFYLVGGVSCLLTGRSQRLGDIAGGTMVIREPKVGRPDLEQVTSYKYNSLREHPLVAARLRQRTSPQEADIALQACLRREELDPSSRVELFAEVAAHFRNLVELPAEAAEGIGAEQLVRDVVDVLFDGSHAG
jgi:uncharacterized RDD family membrane protein YckC